MMRIKDECVGCPDYCINCGARRTKRFYCDRCGEEYTLYRFNGEELCENCLDKALKELKTHDGICEECGEKDVIYSGYGLCFGCLWDGLETVEDFDW